MLGEKGQHLPRILTRLCASKESGMGGAMSALSGREVGVDATLSVLLPPPPPRRLLVPSVAASGEVGAVDIAPAAIASWPLGSSVDECRSQEGWGLAPTEMCVEEVEVRD